MQWLAEELTTTIGVRQKCQSLEAAAALYPGGQGAKLGLVFRMISMKQRLLVTWFIALGLIGAAEAQTAIREHARGHVAMLQK